MKMVIDTVTTPCEVASGTTSRAIPVTESAAVS
jgi:hypothetical protein